MDSFQGIPEGAELALRKSQGPQTPQAGVKRAEGRNIWVPFKFTPKSMPHAGKSQGGAALPALNREGHFVSDGQIV